MGAYLATPPLPWAHNQGGTIILRDKYVSLQDIIKGAVVFQVQDNHGDVYDAAIVQYPSDEKYYLQAAGALLWKLGDISQAVNQINLIPSGNTPIGYSLVNVKVATGYIFEVYANQECTQRPVVGQSYSTLYVKIDPSFNRQREIRIEEGSDQEQFVFTVDDGGSVFLWVDFTGSGTEQIVTVSTGTGPAIEVQSNAVFSFSPIYS